MRVIQSKTRITSWQFIALLIGCMVLGATLSPDLLRFYAGKPDLLISEFLSENQSIRADSDGDFRTGLKFTMPVTKLSRWKAGR